MGGFVQQGNDCVAIPGAPSSGSNGGGGSGGDGSTTATTTGTGGAPGCGALATCHGTCVDVASDPWNCGDCGVDCPSGICVQGACQGGIAGHVVALGFDYGKIGAGSAAARLLGNAAFLHPHSPLRVADFRGFTDATTSAHVSALLDAEGAARGRVVQMTHVLSAGSVAQWLDPQKTDVFLLSVPSGGHPDAIAAVAASWAPALDAFGKEGGVVVALVGVDDPDMLEAALGGTHLFPALSCGAIASGPYVVEDFLDSLTAGLPTPFATPTSGIELALASSPSPTLSLPVVDTHGAAVAVHLVVPPPQSSP